MPVKFATNKMVLFQLLLPLLILPHMSKHLSLSSSHRERALLCGRCHPETYCYVHCKLLHCCQLFRVMQKIHLQGSSCCSVVVPASQQVPIEIGSAWLHFRVGLRERNRLDFQCNLPTFPGHWFSSISSLPWLVSFTISLLTFGMMKQSFQPELKEEVEDRTQ